MPQGNPYISRLTYFGKSFQTGKKIMSKTDQENTQNNRVASKLRRGILVAVPLMLLFAGAFTLVVFNSEKVEAGTDIKVYKNPSCGCCGKWVEYIEKAGFDAEVLAVQDVMPIKKESGVPSNMTSCHTAKVDGYFIEGHVPVEDIQRLLEEQPDIAGLTVPGMPLGSPGMEVPGRKPMAYKVYAVDKAGKISVFSSH